MNKYEVRTQKKKAAITEAALELFGERGYTQVSINEIASRSGVSSVSIYNYFGSKEGLVKQCARILMEEPTKLVNELLAENIGFREKLLRVVSICSEMPYRLLEQYFSKEALSDTVFLELYKESIGELRQDILQAFIDSGKNEGALDPLISTETILDYLNAIAGIQANWESVSEHKGKASELYRLVLFGLIGNEAAPS